MKSINNVPASVDDQRRKGTKDCSLDSRRYNPSHANTPSSAGRKKVGSPTRTIVAVAPPKYAATKTPPKTDVCGIRYTMTHPISRSPMGTITFSGYPNCVIPCTTDGCFTSFIAALNDIIRIGKALKTYPVQTLVLDMALV